jgi:hypothetical protein
MSFSIPPLTQHAHGQRSGAKRPPGIASLSALALTLVLGCSDDEKGTDLGALCGAGGQVEGAAGDTSLPNDAQGGAASEEDLLSRARAQSYRSWQLAPGFAERTPSRGPHATSVDIYVNEVLSRALSEVGLEAWPDGAFIVKDAFSSSGDLALIALMEKRAGAWHYAEHFGPEGERKYEGPSQVCVDCHQGGSDFVLAFPLP